MRALVVGYGRMGAFHARVLRDLGYHVTMVDPDPNRRADHATVAEARPEWAPAGPIPPVFDVAAVAVPPERLLDTAYQLAGPVGDWMEACDACARKAEVINRLTLEQIGVDPDRVVAVENRMGCAPAQRT